MERRQNKEFPVKSRYTLPVITKRKRRLPSLQKMWEMNSPESFIYKFNYNSIDIKVGD